MQKRLYRYIGSHINGIPVQELQPALKEFEELENQNNKIYPIMEEEIFPFLLDNGVEPIVISGSQQEPIDLYKKRMGFQRAFGVQYKILEGKYTQDCIVNTAIGEGKSVIIQELLRREPKTDILFAFGDSEADIPMLKAAKQGFINNSNRFLEQGNINYFDFTSKQAGEQILELMTKSIEQEKKLECDGR